MKTITAEKLSRVEVPEEHRENGIVAVQIVRFTINFFGNVIESVLDTKILEDGRQVVIDGDGYIHSGYELA